MRMKQENFDEQTVNYLCRCEKFLVSTLFTLFEDNFHLHLSSIERELKNPLLCAS